MARNRARTENGTGQMGSDGSIQSKALLNCENSEGRHVAYTQLGHSIGRSCALQCGVREAAQSSLSPVRH